VTDAVLRVVQHKQQSTVLRRLCDQFAGCEVGVAMQLRLHERIISSQSFTTEWLLISPTPSNLHPFPSIHLLLRLETSAPPSTISDAIGIKRKCRGEGVWQRISILVCGGQRGGGDSQGIDDTTASGASIIIRGAIQSAWEQGLKKFCSGRICVDSETTGQQGDLVVVGGFDDDIQIVSIFQFYDRPLSP
jgi:hypothetical protein